MFAIRCKADNKIVAVKNNYDECFDWVNGSPYFVIVPV